MHATHIYIYRVIIWFWKTSLFVTTQIILLYLFVLLSFYRVRSITNSLSLCLCVSVFGWKQLIKWCSLSLFQRYARHVHTICNFLIWNWIRNVDEWRERGGKAVWLLIENCIVFYKWKISQMQTRWSSKIHHLKINWLFEL